MASSHRRQILRTEPRSERVAMRRASQVGEHALEDGRDGGQSSLRRQPTSLTKSSTEISQDRRMLRKVPRSIVACMGTVTGGRPAQASRTWLPFWRTVV